MKTKSRLLFIFFNITHCLWCFWQMSAFWLKTVVIGYVCDGISLAISVGPLEAAAHCNRFVFAASIDNLTRLFLSDSVARFRTAAHAKTKFNS